jgi:hypothetical protein
MRLIRWAIAAGILTLHVVMKDPVWFIFARVDVLSGSTGWHRANLIDRSIANFSDWCWVGVQDVAKWGVWAGDTTNQFVVEGVRGGMGVLLLFIWIAVVAFSNIGLVLKAARKQPRRLQLGIWAVGAGLFSHIVSFLGVSYFDQNIVNWYMVLGMVAALSAEWLPPARRKAPEKVSPGATNSERQLTEHMHEYQGAGECYHSDL